MATDTLHVSQSHPGILSRTAKALSAGFAAWAALRRHRADLALLQRLEPNMLDDLGVSLADNARGEAKVMKIHPAVLASTMNALHRASGR